MPATCFRAAILLAILTTSLLGPAWAKAPANKVSNPGFETLANGKPLGWQPYGSGLEIDESVHHEGDRSIRCENHAATEGRGAVTTVSLNQTQPSPILFSAWSRAADVGGTPDMNYSLYLDLTFQDGSRLYGQTTAFSTGTHGWQKKQVLVTPSKPLKLVTIYVLLRSHTGTAWFDDISAVEMDSDHLFDSQSIAPPRLPRGAQSGWYARDVATDSTVQPLSAEQPNKGLGLSMTHQPGDGGSEEVVVHDLTGKTRAITVYYVERFNAADAVWWNDVRQSIPAGSSGERSNLLNAGAGATGASSIYPLGCVTAGRRGRAVAIPPLLGPRLIRIGFNAGAGLLYIGFDLALTPGNSANLDRDGHSSAKVAVVSFDVDPAWGFRAAWDHYCHLFPEAFDRRAKANGIWIPFTDPSTVDHVEDFGIAYHEGSNSVESDDKLGILSFHYVEPMTWWMPMPKQTPRTYDAAIEMVKSYAAGKKDGNQRNAESLLLSGSKDESGRFNVEFHNLPWADGAVWILNPNPRLPRGDDKYTKGFLDFSPGYIKDAYSPVKKGTLDGEYIDSIEGWATLPDYREESVAASMAPPTFALESRRPVVMTWFSIWELVSNMRKELRSRDKLLMTNGTPEWVYGFVPLMDVVGTEVNWLPGGEYRPDSDATFNLRRTLAYRKPYLMLQNTDFNKFTPNLVEKYFQKAMFYGVFPSMFSIDASNNPYWGNPAWYNRDRPLFRKYIPAIKKLSAAQWEPITYARSDNPSIFLERFGGHYITVFNNSSQRNTATLTLDPLRIGLENGALLIVDAVTGEEVAKIADPSKARFEISLKPEEGRALELVQAH